jgi:hypothetical protein
MIARAKRFGRSLYAKVMLPAAARLLFWKLKKLQDPVVVAASAVLGLIIYAREPLICTSIAQLATYPFTRCPKTCP